MRTVDKQTQTSEEQQSTSNNQNTSNKPSNITLVPKDNSLDDFILDSDVINENYISESFNEEDNFIFSNKELFEEIPFAFDENYLQDQKMEYEFKEKDFQSTIITNFPTFDTLITESEVKAEKFSIERCEEFSTLKKKRGRMPTKGKGTSNRTQHTKTDIDNILRKIKVHFQKCIDQTMKNLIYIQNNNKQRCIVRKLKGKTIQNVTIEHNKDLLNKTMKEFLSQPISDKYANVDENQNIITINKLMKKPLIASFLNMTFEEVYIRLFVEEQNLFGEEFNGMFKSLHTLSKFLSGLRDKYDEAYCSKVEFVAKDKFVNYYKSGKERKIKKQTKEPNL